MGGHSSETVVQVQQTATQSQEVNVNKDLQGTIDKLVGVLNEQAKNPPSGSISVTTPPVNVIPVFLQSEHQPTQADQAQTDMQQPQPYNNAEVSQLLAMMYYNVLKGQQEVQNPGESPVNLKTIFIVAAIVIIAIFLWRGK